MGGYAFSAGGTGTDPLDLMTMVNSNSILINGSSGTFAVPVFRVTGVVLVFMLYGELTVAFGTNHTAASLRLNDQTATTQMTSLAGTSFNNYAIGNHIYKRFSAATGIQGASATNTSTLPSASSNSTGLVQFLVGGKAGANTDMEYVYTTTNAPTTGAVTFSCLYLPLSTGAAVSAI